MNRLHTSGASMNGMLIPVLVLAACLMGLLVPYQPILLIIAVSGFTVFLMSILYPEKMSYVICITSVISMQYIIPFDMMGVDLQSLYKIGILMLLLPAMFYFGIHRAQSLPIIAFFGLLLITYLFSDQHPLLTTAAPIKAFIGLAAPFVFLLIRWRPAVAARHIRIICFMPLISIVFGALFHVTGLYPLFITEFTGAFRMQGANIPAHLAFLAFIALSVSIIEIRRNPERLLFYYAMTGLNLLILLSTGTRGPLIAVLVLVAVFFFDLIKQFIGGRVNRIVPLLLFIVVIVASVFWQLDNFKKRSFNRTTEEVVDTSGRAEAWAFFLDGVKDSPWFGRGLGSVLVSNDGSIYHGFIVPHNEYIRFYYDGGMIGVMLLFLGLLYVFRNVYTRLAPQLKPYFFAFIIGVLIYSISDNTLSTLQFVVPFCIYLCALRNLHDHQNGKEVT